MRVLPVSRLGLGLGRRAPDWGEVPIPSTSQDPTVLPPRDMCGVLQQGGLSDPTEPCRSGQHLHVIPSPLYGDSVIKSANQYPVYALLSHEGNLVYQIPPYQREYSWQKVQWEDLFQDLREAEGPHFMGTIITLNKTTDAVDAGVLELIDGQQRMTTLTLLMAAIYSVLEEHKDELDEETRIDQFNLGRQLVLKAKGEPRVTPQIQGHNLADYHTVLADAGLPVQTNWKPYYPLRRIAKCYGYFRESLVRSNGSGDVTDGNHPNPVKTALTMLRAVKSAILVKIEVDNHADAFVLFESLNNRGMPLTPVDLIKNELIAESERKNIMSVEDAFKLWNSMLTNLGDTYANQERFLRHYYNAFKADLPPIQNAQVATRSNLIRIYESLLRADIKVRVDALVAASKIYGRVTCVAEPDDPTELDDALRRLMNAQGAPSYVVVMWLLSKRSSLELQDPTLVKIVDLLTSFFVRRNLTGSPQTYALPRLFMTIIEKVAGEHGGVVLSVIADELANVSSSDVVFREKLAGPIYEENSDVARFILTTLAEDAMTKETWQDLWAQENGHYRWTIEHILPQGVNLPDTWKEMLGGAEGATAAQEQGVHRLGNLTITAYNSTLSNKSFLEKRDRTDSQGRYIGYRNGFKLNEDLATRDSWTLADIGARTAKLADQVIARFPLS